MLEMLKLLETSHTGGEGRGQQHQHQQDHRWRKSPHEYGEREARLLLTFKVSSVWFLWQGSDSVACWLTLSKINGVNLLLRTGCHFGAFDCDFTFMWCLSKKNPKTLDLLQERVKINGLATCYCRSQWIIVVCSGVKACVGAVATCECCLRLNNPHPWNQEKGRVSCGLGIVNSAPCITCICTREMCEHWSGCNLKMFNHLKKKKYLSQGKYCTYNH